MPASVTQRYLKALSEEWTVPIDCRGYLGSEETIDTIDDVSVSGTDSALVAENETINDDDVECLGRTVPAGKAILLDLSGGTADVTYEIRVLFTTSDGQVKQIRNLFIVAIAD